MKGWTEDDPPADRRVGYETQSEKEDRIIRALADRLLEDEKWNEPPAVFKVVTWIGLVILAILTLALVAGILIQATGVRAAEPTPDWGPCVGGGWQAGDVWGPGPLDYIPDGTPQCVEDAPEPSAYDIQRVTTQTLPPTDTE